VAPANAWAELGYLALSHSSRANVKKGSLPDEEGKARMQVPIFLREEAEEQSARHHCRALQEGNPKEKEHMFYIY
jgi:hypothetical protein